MNARQKAKKYKQAFDRLNELNNIHNVYRFSYTNLEEVKICHKISYFPYREMSEEMLMQYHIKHLAEEFERYIPEIMTCEDNKDGNIAKIRFWICREDKEDAGGRR